jgi:excisionase family DNA binding protein
MVVNSGLSVPPGTPVLLERLVGKVESLESMLGELFARKFPSLETTLADLRALLTRRRKDHYVVEEVAQLTGRSAYTIRRWISEGKLKAIRLRDGGPRGKLLIPRTELERLVGAGMGENVPDALVNEGQSPSGEGG